MKRKLVRKCFNFVRTIVTFLITSFLLFVTYIYFYNPQVDFHFNPFSPCERVHKKFGRPILIAHRGSRSIAPENTLFAFETSLSLGADMLEFDVQLTKDDDLVLIHDEFLER